MKLKRKKGDLKFISSKKTAGLLYTLLCALAGIVIFFIGYFLNKKSNANVFTILAVLMVLPGAKMLTGAIILFPFKDALKEEEDMLKEIIPKDSLLLSSVVFTSPEKVMNLDFIWIGDGYVYGCLGKENQDIAYMQGYLSKGVHNYVTHYQIKLFRDALALKKAIHIAAAKNCTEEEQEKVKDYILSLIV